MNAIQKRQLAKLVYVAPEPLLEKNSSIVDEITRGSEAVRHFTGSQKKKYLEEYQAGFLAFMLKHILAKQMTGLYVEPAVSEFVTSKQVSITLQGRGAGSGGGSP
jgi:hypothetical protein